MCSVCLLRSQVKAFFFLMIAILGICTLFKLFLVYFLSTFSPFLGLGTGLDIRTPRPIKRELLEVMAKSEFFQLIPIFAIYTLL